jgi:hypothetical protein
MSRATWSDELQPTLEGELADIGLPAFVKAEPMLLMME